MSVSRRAFAIGLGAVPLLQNKTRAAEAPPQAHPPSPEAAAPPVPKVFDEHELATVAALAELIIPATDTPGARDAHVAEYLDLILSDSPLEVRSKFLQGLWWFDGHCRQSAAALFKDLPPPEQLRLVTELYDSSDESIKTGRTFLHSMKTWTARIYYSTEIGYQDLNKGGRVPAHYVKPCASE